jgi:hypothetical protein
MAYLPETEGAQQDKVAPDGHENLQDDTALFPGPANTLAGVKEGLAAIFDLHELSEDYLELFFNELCDAEVLPAYVSEYLSLEDPQRLVDTFNYGFLSLVRFFNLAQNQSADISLMAKAILWVGFPAIYALHTKPAKHGLETPPFQTPESGNNPWQTPEAEVMIGEIKEAVGKYGESSQLELLNALATDARAVIISICYKKMLPFLDSQGSDLSRE